LKTIPYTNQINSQEQTMLSKKKLVTTSSYTYLYEDVSYEKPRGAPNDKWEQIDKPDPFAEVIYMKRERSRRLDTNAWKNPLTTLFSNAKSSTISMKRTTFKHKKRTAARDETYTEQICNIKQKEKATNTYTNTREFPSENYNMIQENQLFNTRTHLQVHKNRTSSTARERERERE